MCYEFINQEAETKKSNLLDTIEEVLSAINIATLIIGLIAFRFVRFVLFFCSNYTVFVFFEK